MKFLNLKFKVPNRYLYLREHIKILFENVPRIFETLKVDNDLSISLSVV